MKFGGRASGIGHWALGIGHWASGRDLLNNSPLSSLSSLSSLSPFPDLYGVGVSAGLGFTASELLLLISSLY